LPHVPKTLVKPLVAVWLTVGALSVYLQF